MFGFGRFFRLTVGSAVVAATLAFGAGSTLAQTSLLNVSYDPTGEPYQDYDAAFSSHRQMKIGKVIHFRQSRGDLSILSELPVAVIDKVVEKRAAQAYLDYLYSKEGQSIAARHFYQPRDAKVAARFAVQPPNTSWRPSTTYSAAG